MSNTWNKLLCIRACRNSKWAPSQKQVNHRKALHAVQQNFSWVSSCYIRKTRFQMTCAWCLFFLSLLVFPFLFFSAPFFSREWKTQCCFTNVCWLVRSPSCLRFIGETSRNKKYHWMFLMAEVLQKWAPPPPPGTVTHEQLLVWNVFSLSIGKYLNGRSIHTYCIIFLWSLQSQKKGLNLRNSLQ